ncbi:MAG: GtrA family protein [Clostridiales bacterium]|nr:GtrA family protein [Clostridiales bacterium]
MEKPIVYIHTYTEKIDQTAKAMLASGFLVAVPYTCPWTYEGIIVVPDYKIKKRGVIRGGIKHIHDIYGERDIILAEEYVTAEDVMLVYSTMQEHPESFVLSEREDPTGSSRFEKAASKIIRGLFAIVQGRLVHDMHSGVRGLPGQYLSAFYDMKGKDRDQLLGQIMSLRRLSIPLVQCNAISQGTRATAHTVLELLKDIGRVGMLFMMFVSSSLFSAVVDFSIYTAMLHFLTPSLFVASATARAISSIINFTINQSVVFQHTQAKSKWKMLAKYYMLVVSLWTIDLLVLLLFVKVFGFNPIIAKFIVGAMIYAISFIFQRDFVFKEKGHTDG